MQQKLTEVGEVCRMELCLMNVNNTAVLCYSVYHVTAQTNGYFLNTETPTRGIRINIISTNYHSN